MEYTSQVDTGASADSSCGCCQTNLDAGEVAQDQLSVPVRSFVRSFVRSLVLVGFTTSLSLSLSLSLHPRHGDTGSDTDRCRRKQGRRRTDTGKALKLCQYRA